jgi:hypothetical protein
VPELKYSKGTDTEHEIKLESQLIFASWRSGVARAGGAASFEVGTAFVGDGAAIKITGKGDQGTKLGKLTSKIKNNKFVGQFDIPGKAKSGETIYFKVKITKNGLSGESNRIPVLPPIAVSDMKWSAQEARRGDILTLSAGVDGCDDYTEAKIIVYEYDGDGAHDRIADLPAEVVDNKIEAKWEYEYHEDTDEMPTEDELAEYGSSYNPPEYFFVIEIDGQKFGAEQESGLLTFKDYIEFDLKDEDGAPLANVDYILHLPDGSQRRGSVDRVGRGRETEVPPGKTRLEISGSGSSTQSSASPE